MTQDTRRRVGENYAQSGVEYDDLRIRTRLCQAFEHTRQPAGLAERGDHHQDVRARPDFAITHTSAIRA